MRTLPEDMIEVYTRPELHVASIWLHGLGVGGADLDGIVTSMKQCRNLGLHYLAPNAPVRPITVNQGMPCRAWFDIIGDPELDGVDEQGLAESCARIHQLLDEEVARGIAAEHILLGGFSQGGSLALHAGLSYPKRLAGIVALSAEVLLHDQLLAQCHEANRCTPILMVHGEQDEAVPVGLARQGCQRLIDAGLSVGWECYPIGHQVTADVVSVVDDWAFPLLAGAVAQ